MPSRRNLSSRMERLEKEVEELMKSSKGLRKSSEGLRKSSEELKKSIEEQWKEIEELRKLNEEVEHSRQDFEGRLGAVMRVTVIPTVATVVLESFYKKGMQLVHTSDPVPDGCPDIIRRYQNEFNDFGLANEQEMLEFAEAWQGMVLSGGVTGRQVTGDEVVLALSYCDGNLYRVLERAFMSLWGISPSDWHNATKAQKALALQSSPLP